MAQGGEINDKVLFKELSYNIVGILFEVYNEIGYGYKEKHYEKAIEKYFINYGIKYIRQPSFLIAVKGEIIGRHYLDFLVENKIILEIKKGNYYSKKNIDQVKGYLKATGMKLAILANFTSDGVKFLRLLNLY